jgi:hypothetical protein
VNGQYDPTQRPATWVGLGVAPCNGEDNSSSFADSICRGFGLSLQMRDMQPLFHSIAGQ